MELARAKGIVRVNEVGFGIGDADCFGKSYIM